MEINCLGTIERIRKRQNLKGTANLAIVQVGDNPISNLYIKSKQKEADKWNVSIQVIKTDENIETDELLGYIYDLNHSRDIDGIILQLPVPKHIDEEKVIAFIDEKKNVDGFKQYGIKSKYFEPCTPLGVITLLETIFSLEGKNVTLIGRGKTVGEPLRDMLLDRNCTLTVCHSYTPKYALKPFLRASDIVISAVGKPSLFSAKDLKEDSVVIDCGISYVDGKQVGDFDHENAKWIWYTPWVNGVGKLTVASLMMNVRKAYELRRKV